MANEEVMEFTPDDQTVEDTDDGGAIIRTGPPIDEEQTKNWFDNIVETIPEPELEKLVVRLLEDIERDKKSREKRDQQYEEAIKRTGLGKEAP